VASRRDDLLDHPGRHRGVGTGSLDGAAQVVDDDPSAALGEQAGVGAPDAAAGAGDDGDAILEADLGQTATGAW
jgi:hypothetical protein